MRKAEDMAGRVFGRLTAVSLAKSRTGKGGARWNCVCSCGKSADVRADSLREGKTKSCGCLAVEISTARCYRHGHHNSATYSSWEHMLDRCSNPNFKHFSYYGGRGIAVCDRWRKFENFLADMGERPERLTLDRIDTNGNYEPTNCKWSTRSEQQYNRRNCLKYRMESARGNAARPVEVPVP
jgi:hypothetical protein